MDKVNRFGPNKELYTDDHPRLHVEYARWNPVTHRVEYVWDGQDGNFTPNPFRGYHPGQPVPVSTVGGNQVEHTIAIRQVPITGDWWIVYNDDWLGYYSGSLFTQLHAGACVAAWYVEAARWKPDPSTPEPWPKTEGGSGNFPDAGLLNAAYVRNPKYLDTYFAGFGVDAKVDKEATPYNKACYEYKEVYWGAHRLIVMGGPGGKNPGCPGP